VQWSSLTVADLKKECSARKLSTKGLKDELIQRLQVSSQGSLPEHQHQRQRLPAFTAACTCPAVAVAGH